jgi:hypothetical protein
VTIGNAVIEEASCELLPVISKLMLLWFEFLSNYVELDPGYKFDEFGMNYDEVWMMGIFVCRSFFIMPPIIKCRGHHVMAYALMASVSINIWLPSIIGQTPGSIDPIFLWLIEGD